MAGSMLAIRQLLTQMSDEPLIVPTHQRPCTEHKGARAPGTRKARPVPPSNYPRKPPKSPPCLREHCVHFPPAGDFGGLLVAYWMAGSGEGEDEYLWDGGRRER